ncbi:peptidoglycan binding domain-containing protein, partial [Nocardia sp. R7R-8]|uniref:peptidoglycan binding domain-containing protein n=1 Tax=Nocardia sp. R7R-8 TaxID=3459304 RepID=UPI00403D736E
MASQPSTGRRGPEAGGEVGLRRLLGSDRSRAADSVAWTGDDQLTQPLHATRRRPVPPAPRRAPARRPISTPPPKRLDSAVVRRVGIAVGVVLAVAGLGYLVDWVMSSGEVARGTVVAGVDVGGMDKAVADAKLRAELDPRAGRELPLRIGDVRTSIVPSAAGLAVDWDATWSRIGSQPLNPFTRLASFFTTHEVPIVSAIDEPALDRRLTELRVHDRPSVEGTITFDKAEPVAVPPVAGRVLDVAAARTELAARWVTGTTVDLPVVPAPLQVRPEAVDKALREIARPAVRAPISFAGKGASGRLDPEQIASVLVFGPDGQGGLAASVNQDAAIGLLGPQLATTEVEPKDATFAVSGGRASVVPAVVGDKINWLKTFEQFTALLTAPG